MSSLIPLGLTGALAPEMNRLDVTEGAPEVTWADIDQLGDAEVLMEGLRADANPADVPMYEAAYNLALECAGIRSTD